MKVTFQYGLAGYTGKADGLVFCYSRTLGRVYARRNTYPRLTPENERVKSITSSLFAIQPSKAYCDDLRFYISRYNSLRENHAHPVRSWPELYLKLMYKMAKTIPNIDLFTMTREYIYEHELPCISIKSAVEAGLLPAVYDYTRFNSEI
ncbi:MAG: hypothetical protein CVU48_06625 [Candidatus Cloacimonetes bacterium HGW-Cloacimonetes-1]|nr:MAG: hypothetical protein CVU48_06625 [Candidatus Cloacimonetes bacterium HGW-Cloacimonetes-1]